MTEYITYNTDDVVLKSGTLEEVRNAIDNSSGGEQAEVAVAIRIWRDNRLDKARNCVKSLLKYTTDVRFKLVLVNNGGSQMVTDFFKSIDYDDKLIIQVTKNISAPHGGGIAQRLVRTKYFVELLNDNVVTYHWLSNMLACLNSNPKIGVACPMCTNTSCYQAPSFADKSIEELLHFAETFNKSDPSLWEERMCIIPQGAVFRRAVYDQVGIYDKGYMHEYADDDISLRVRRAGYKLVLCKDTFVIHDHDYSVEPASTMKVKQGEQGFMDKFHGLNPGTDYKNWIIPWIDSVDVPSKDIYKILGIDCRAGEPILDVKNKAYVSGNRKFQCDAFTTDPKYYEDLSSICKHVYCDRDEGHIGCFIKEKYDFIVIEKTINEFNRPFELLDFVMQRAVGGYVLFKLKNMQDAGVLLQCFGGNNPARLSGFQYITLSEINEYLSSFKTDDVRIMREECISLKNEMQRIFSNTDILAEMHCNNIEKVKQELNTFRYWILVKVAH